MPTACDFTRISSGPISGGFTSATFASLGASNTKAFMLTLSACHTDANAAPGTNRFASRLLFGREHHVVAHRVERFVQLLSIGGRARLVADERGYQRLLDAKDGVCVEVLVPVREDMRYQGPVS